MKRLLAWTLVAAMAAPALPRIASGGVVIEVEMHGPKEGSSQGTSTLHADPDRLSVRNQAIWAIFRGDKKVLWLVDEKAGKYTEVSDADLEQMQQQMSGAMAEMQKEMANLPPEQRAMIEKMMSGKMPAMPKAETPEPLTYKPTGKSETIHGHACTSYDVLRGGKRVGETWVADWKQFDLRPDDFKVMNAFSEFVKQMAGPMAKQFDTGFEHKFVEGPKGDGLPGVPVRTITTTDAGDIVTELKKVSRETIAPAEFELPAGLKREPMVDKTRGGKRPDKGK